MSPDEWREWLNTWWPYPLDEQYSFRIDDDNKVIIEELTDDAYIQTRYTDIIKVIIDSNYIDNNCNNSDVRYQEVSDSISKEEFAEFIYS